MIDGYLRTTHSNAMDIEPEIDLEFWRQRIKRRLSALIESDDAASTSRNTVDLDQTKVGRLSRMDALQAQSMNQAIAARRRQEIERLMAALKRIDEDEFGYCGICGNAIVIKRLELDPSTVNCMDCRR